MRKKYFISQLCVITIVLGESNFWFRFRSIIHFFTVCKRSCGKVMFLHLSVSHSVYGGVSTSVHAGIQPPEQTPPCPVHAGIHTPLPSACWDTHPLSSACWDTPPAQCMLGYTPPAQCMLGYTVPSACWDRHGYCCGQYTSYWNAFLLPL